MNNDVDSDRPDLEHRFHQAMIRIHARAKSECHYNPTRFIQMIHRYGGLQTARMLLRSPNPSYGLSTLWRCGRLDLSMEALVLSPEFDPLFSEEERELARNQLAGLGYVQSASPHPASPRDPALSHKADA